MSHVVVKIRVGLAMSDGASFRGRQTVDAHGYDSRKEIEELKLQYAIEALRELWRDSESSSGIEGFEVFFESVEVLRS